MPPQVQRAPLEQTFFNVPLSITNVAAPLSSTIQLTSMIQSFIIGNPSANTASIFWGDISMTTSADGQEITPGSSQLFVIEEIRQLYELQDPELTSAQVAICQQMTPVSIPVVCWNPLNFFLVAAVAGPTPAVATFFRNVYV